MIARNRRPVRFADDVDDVLVDRLVRGTDPPEKIPYGMKAQYAAAMMNRGVPGKTVAKDLRISGTTYSRALRIKDGQPT